MKPRILFLGATYHPLSVACLEALIDGGTVADVLVVRDGAEPTRRALARVWRQRGARAVVRRTRTVAIGRTRLAVRALGLPLRGAASLDEICVARNLRVIRCGNVNELAFARDIAALGIDLLVIANYPRRLPRHLYSAPRLGAINVHPSLLPAFRGPDPVYWMRASGADLGGVTVHHVDDGFDTGPIVLQQAFPIGPNESERTILSRAVAVARALLPRSVELLLTGHTAALTQDTAHASYFSSAPRGASTL